MKFSLAVLPNIAIFLSEHCLFKNDLQRKCLQTHLLQAARIKWKMTSAKMTTRKHLLELLRERGIGGGGGSQQVLKRAHLFRQCLSPLIKPASDQTNRRLFRQCLEAQFHLFRQRLEAQFHLFRQRLEAQCQLVRQRLEAQFQLVRQRLKAQCQLCR